MARSTEAPITSPDRVHAMKQRGELKPEKVAEYRSVLAEATQLRNRHAKPRNAGSRELHRIAAWVVDQWGAEDAALLQ